MASGQADVQNHLDKQRMVKFPWLKAGIRALGFSIGLFIISVLADKHLIDNGALPLAILGICGGISMVIANFIKDGNSKQ